MSELHRMRFFQSDWFLSRPMSVQETFWRFPPGATFEIEGKIAYMVGVAELESPPHGLWLSYVDPALDYDRAVGARFMVCSSHFDDAALKAPG